MLFWACADCLDNQELLQTWGMTGELNCEKMTSTPNDLNCRDSAAFTAAVLLASPPEEERAENAERGGNQAAHINADVQSAWIS